MSDLPPPTVITDPLMDMLSTDHFLSLPRPDVFTGPPPGVVDTTTLAAHDFDVDTRTGFMPPQPPPARLPETWEQWEAMLDYATTHRLQLGDKPELNDDEAAESAAWRARLREMPILPTTDLTRSEPILRRAHHVLAWLMHFYIHTLPPSTPSIIIPLSITIPHLRVCAQLRLPPVITYSDDVLYNWTLRDATDPGERGRPKLDNLQSQTLFTGTRDEEEFYLASSRIELRGVDALALMRATMDEAFVGDDIALRRITGYLRALVGIVDDLKAILLRVREGCDPEVFYRQIRPWFRGADSDRAGRPWVFEGAAEAGLDVPEELSGPSAGQSTLIHALDIFLGVDQYTPDAELGGTYGTSASTSASSSSSKPAPSSFMKRMHAYMPRHHRAFLAHLLANPRPLRALVSGAADTAPELTEAYNGAVRALKSLRDAHMTIVAQYIVGPARRVAKEERERSGEEQVVKKREEKPLQGTGGSDLVRFLKGVRDRTAEAIMLTEQGTGKGE